MSLICAGIKIEELQQYRYWFCQFEEIVPANRRYFKLEEMQKYVGGLIQIIPLDGEGLEDMLLVVNEEGKNIGLSFNPFATIEWTKYYGETDFISGDAIICHPQFIK